MELIAFILAVDALTMRPSVAPSRPLAGSAVLHLVQDGERLADIGARRGVEARTLARVNGLSPQDALEPGDTLEVPAVHVAPLPRERGIVVNLPQRMLYLWQDGRLAGSWPVAVGSRGWKTPRGSFSVARKEVDPAWDVPRSIQREMRRKGRRVVRRVAPGPSNPLGPRWIGLSVGAIGIHGTNEPSTIYGFRTHGCIRMHPDDVVALYDRVDVGMPVELVYEPVLLTVAEGRVWLEVHPDPYRKLKRPLELAQAQAESLGVAGLVDWDRVDEILKARDGIAHAVGRVEDRPMPQGTLADEDWLATRAQ